MGRIYLVSVLIGGIAGLYMAVTAFGGLPTRIGFSMLGVLWLVTGAMAYLRIRRGNVHEHRQWMIRNYALTFSAVMLRVWLPLLIALGYEFPEAYTTVAWLCWVPNLLVVEMIIRNGKALVEKRQPKSSAASVPAVQQIIEPDSQLA
jgi:peptidoglycan biosynthesis protein MviN/MurJ (putative lipid II flippase)